MPRRRRPPPRRRRRWRHRQNGRGIMSVLAKAAKMGYKLGRDKRYKRMRAIGATGHYTRYRSGKSELVEQWLRYLNVFQVKPKKIVYVYDRWQPWFDRMQKKDGIQFHRGLPDPGHLTKWFGATRGGVLVLDDLMEEGGQDKRVLDLFTKDSHHRNITVLYLTQDLFPPGKFSKTINRNAHYIVAFKNPRDQTGIRTILLQAFPDRWRQVLRLFKRVTSRPFGYLMLDVHPASDDRYRLWSHLTTREGKAQVHTLPVDVPAVRKRAATKTRPSTSAKRRRTRH